MTKGRFVCHLFRHQMAVALSISAAAFFYGFKADGCFDDLGAGTVDLLSQMSLR